VPESISSAPHATPLPPAAARPAGSRWAWAFLIDLAVFLLVFSAVYGVYALGRSWLGPVTSGSHISQNPRILPLYSFYSLTRIAIAYALSLVFALSYGYLAARSRRAELVLIPLLDILQSIPVLSFLPGVMLAMVALFPRRQLGVELGSILLIFTGQVWNMAFSFYSSLKTIPRELREVARIYRFSRWQRFVQLDLPFSTIGLVWNSMMSVAGGWFFLMACEMFVLGDRDFRLPGLGSYLQTAASNGDTRALLWGLAAMIAVIVLLDQLLWRPLVVWVEKFRLDETTGGERKASSWVLDFLRRARLPRRVAVFRRRAYRTARWAARPLERPLRAATPVILRGPRVAFEHPVARKLAGALLVAAIAAGAAAGLWQLGRLLGQLGLAEWRQLASSAALTFLRVMGAVLLSTAWALPAGVVIGRSPQLARALQPVIQVVASFPAPMLFPVVVLLFERIGVGLGLGAVALMVLAGQWYVLFNVIAAVAVDPQSSTSSKASKRT